MRGTLRAVMGGACVAALPLALAAGPPVAGADTGTEVESELAPVMVVLDASGSMEEDDDPAGGTRMDAARTALHTLVDDTPAEARMGLTVYGATPEAYDDLELGCEDIVTSRPVDALDKKDFKSAVDEVKPGGYTPIGSSLRHAADELPDEGPRSVILISDGEDTCAPPPPCEVAQELADEGVDLAIHTVGFKVDDKTREDLECIADSAGGTYVDAPDAATLQKELPAVAERALRSYELQGTPITGTDEPSDAPEIEAGQWVDTIKDGQKKHYGLEIPDGFRAHVAATLVPPLDESSPGSVDWLEVTTAISTRAGEECVAEDANHISRDTIYTSAFSWQPDDSDECAGRDDLYFTVEREGHAASKYPEYDMELVVILEPPLVTDGIPETDAAPPEMQDVPGSEQPVVGGGSFNDATELDGSGMYTDNVRYGEMATYKVWLDWGEAVAAQVHTGKVQAEDYSGSWRTIRSSIYSPTRTTDNDWEARESRREDAESLDPMATEPVLISNRETGSGTFTTGTASLAGWYYITVDVDPDPSTAEIPVTLEVLVAGEKADAPQYEKVDDYPAEPMTEPLDTSEPDTSETDASEQDDTSDERSDEGAQPTDEDSEDTTAPVADSGDSGMLGQSLFVAAGVLALAAVLFGIGLGLRKRRPSGGS